MLSTIRIEKIKKLINENLNEKEKNYYDKYLCQMIEKGFIEVQYFIKHKNLFFKYMK